MLEVGFYLDFSRHGLGALIFNRWRKRSHTNGYRFERCSFFSSFTDAYRSESASRFKMLLFIFCLVVFNFDFVVKLFALNYPSCDT